jgi:hypothetical protein
VFSSSRGWYYPKLRPKRDNPVSILRDILIQKGKWPDDPKERSTMDKLAGEVYLYAEGEIDGIIL